jgi:catechol 2,3-dioxygenase-like lactoylglutathione lyase family enzyme
MAQNIATERVDHIGVRVRNLDRAVGFYRVLGFAVVRRAEGDDVAIIRNEHGVELNLVFGSKPASSSEESSRKSAGPLETGAAYRERGISLLRLRCHERRRTCTLYLGSSNHFFAALWS